MKKDTVKVSFEAEKLRAINIYMEKKELDLEDELMDQLQKLYEKYVPANVREYIDEKQEEAIKRRKPKKSAKKQVETNIPSIKQE
ncbi:DUF6103 family protein [Tissierella praeacuta]|uniref:DUF6103 family protein n=1 Tax=Tissierella praeacuta TaxID=43131 RepID=UPI001C124C42|nr:DUF6103 family protein [Tissierella praeacuta]MBU5255216.1 hypothetical protein [Tissierella praeacuta]